MLDLLIYLPRREYRCFRRYLRGIREVASDIVRESIGKGDGRDIMSVLLRANNSEDPKTKLSGNEVLDQIGYVGEAYVTDINTDTLQNTSFGRALYVCKYADMVLLGTC